MPGLNKVMLIGRLGRDPETRWFEGGRVMSKVSLATSERFKTPEGEMRERTEWHSVVLWGALGQIADDHLRKGDRIYVEGRLRTRSWQDAEGTEHRATEIVGDRLEMLGNGHPSPPSTSQTDSPAEQPAGPEPMDASTLPF